ncbi:MAG: glycosidase [Armatimonadetes bacterium]|nr:glycosidase [Armatimonadota bacterium]
MIGPWVKRRKPVLEPSLHPENFDSRNVYNMATIKEDGVVSMIYRGESLSEPAGSMTGRFGLATSTDGIRFSRFPTDVSPRPILEPTEPYESRGIEDPRLVKVEDTYVLTYTGYDGQKGQLCLATSKDKIHWKKHGPIFPNFKQGDCPLVPHSPVGATKSGAILPERLEEGPYAGKYMMIFGDTTMHLAVSADLVHWEPIEKPVLEPRWDRFDSLLVESGPPLLRTQEGILCIYNSAGHDLDPPAGSTPEEASKFLFAQRRYAVGMALLDPKDPTRVLARTDEPILTVTEDWEKNGYVGNVVFSEGLVKVNGEWLMHYGGADHVIGVAKAPFDESILPEGSSWRQE